MPKLEPFDPSRPLVANTFIRLHAITYRKGNTVPYDPADHRVLNRLYELRKIGYGEGVEVELTTPRQRFMSGNTERRLQADEAEGRAISTIDDQMAETNADEQALVDQLLADRANTHDALIRKASGIAGVTKSMKKAEIALALVRAGRGPA